MGFRRERINDYFLLDTGVENIFINEYMAAAPGDFVKVYLFALMYAGLGIEVSDEEIGRYLDMEHGEVRKAWNYWEKAGVIRKINKKSDNQFDYDVEFLVLKGQLYGEKTGSKSAAMDQNTQSFMADKQIKDMFLSIEKTTGRVFNSTELMEVVSWINDFGAAPEVIAYGYSYCYQKKKKDIKYISAVIKAWTSEGIRDVIALEKYLSEYDKKQFLYKRVLQALGLSRNPTEAERRIMSTWFETMEFPLDTVLDACAKTTGISNPNINYVNKVLVNWYEKLQKGQAIDGPSTDKSLTTGDIMRYYEALRRQHEEAAEERRREVYAAVPRIREIEDEAITLSSEMSKIIISNRADRKTAMDELKGKMDALNMEKAFLLTDNGFEIDYMEIKYDCPECRDTGMLETGERCQCFGKVTREKIDLLNRQKTK